MALQKTVVDDKGYSAEYHKIVSYSYDAYSDATSITVFIFKDQVARVEGKAICGTQNYVFNNSGEPSSREMCYTLLKSHEDYIGAIDC